jgi:integrase
MPNVDLDAAFVRQAVCIEGKAKTDYYDNAITGFLLECRASGGKTYALRHRDSHGRQRQIKIGDAKSISFDKARSAAEKLRSRVVLGESPAEEKKAKRTIPTIAELYRDTYLPHLQKTRRNMGSDLSFWKNHILPKLGHLHLDELTPQDVIDAQMTMRQDGYAPGTSNKWIVQIRYMYNVAKRLKIPGSDSNPGGGIKQFLVEGRQRFLSPAETERLRLAVDRSENTQLKYIVALLLMLGCRKRELLDAKWEQFDLERRTWRIPLAKAGKSRNVPLSLAAIAVLEKVRRWKGCPYVVPNPYTFKPFTGINESWKTAKRRAGITECHLHDLRHTFASSMAGAGVSILVISRALGHSTTRQSEIYAHLADQHLLAGVDAAANTMSKAWTSTEEATPAQP